MNTCNGKSREGCHIEIVVKNDLWSIFVAENVTTSNCIFGIRTGFQIFIIMYQITPGSPVFLDSPISIDVICNDRIQMTDIFAHYFGIRNY